MLIRRLIYFPYLFIITYLLCFTGLVSDDFTELNDISNRDISDLFIPKRNHMNAPIGHFSHNIWFYFADIDNFTLIYILKITYFIISFFMMSRFFAIFLSEPYSLLISFLFLFYPSHDAIGYWYPQVSHALVFAIYFYAYYLAHNNRLLLAFLSASVASFMTYGSSPVAFSLFILFLLGKEYRKGIIIIIPNIVYAMYFILMSLVLKSTPSRVLEEITVLSITKLFSFQFFTFLDATIGPSMWLKVYYAFFQLSALSFIIGVIFSVLIYLYVADLKIKIDRRLLKFSIILMLTSFVMFAITGRYPQLAFNLGNRTTFWGSLFIVYLFLLLPGKYLRTFFFSILFFTILGISDHWKNLTIHQQQIIGKIRTNQKLINYNDTKILFVSGNQYSKYGPVSHIEFFSENWVVNSVFNLALEKSILCSPINKRHYYSDGYMIDTKYNRKIQVVDYINIYDSEKDVLIKMKPEKINHYIDTLPSDKRHWIFMLNNSITSLIEKVVVFFIPKLVYIF